MEYLNIEHVLNIRINKNNKDQKITKNIIQKLLEPVSIYINGRNSQKIIKDYINKYIIRELLSALKIIK